MQAFVGGSGNSNGIFARRSDDFVICRHGSRDVASMDTNGNIISLVSSYDGKSLNSPNDICESYLGSLYFTDPPYGIKQEEEELGFYGVYCLPFDGSGLVLLDNLLTKPNGIVFSPDGQVLYVCDTYSNKIMAYKLRNESQVKDRWIFAELSGTGGADGITTDLYGNVYIAFGDGGIEVYSPEGDKKAHIDMPEKTRNLCFGGKYRNILFITAGNSFSFAIEADPHLDESSNYTTFRNMLQNARKAEPDFLIDLGDNFMTDKMPVINYHHIEQRNLL